MSDLNDAFDLDLNDLTLDGFDENTSTSSPIPTQDINFIRNIPVNLTLEVASTELMVGDLMNITLGSVIELDKISGAPMDVKINGTLLGHAEVVIVNNKYGLRLISIVEDNDMIQSVTA